MVHICLYKDAAIVPLPGLFNFIVLSICYNIGDRAIGSNIYTALGPAKGGALFNL
jgi:hypothetical protein